MTDDCASCRRLRRVLYTSLGRTMSSNAGYFPGRVKALRRALKHLKPASALYASFRRKLKASGCFGRRAHVKHWLRLRLRYMWWFITWSPFDCLGLCKDPLWHRQQRIKAMYEREAKEGVPR